MNAKPRYVLVGMFVLLLGLALIAGILWLTAGGPPRNYDFYRVYMTESVSGLSIDAPVKYKGVNRGRVRDIDLDPDNPQRVRVLLQVQEGTPVNADTVATLEFQGLTGIASINLSGGNRSSPELSLIKGERYPVIRSRPSLLVRLDQTVSELLGSLIETSQRVNALLDESNRAAIGETLASVASATEVIAERSVDLEQLVGEVRAILGDGRAAAAALPELIAQFQNSAASLESMADALADTGITLQSTGRSLQRTVEESGEDLRRFTGSALPQTTALVTDLRYAADNLRRVSETLERDPSALIRGVPPPPPGPGEAGR